MFFCDKGMFFSAMITPLILLVLYATFLARIYKNSFLSALPDGFSIDESLIDATVAGQLVSSLLAVSCVTVAFCSNLIMIGDRTNGTVRDMTVSPVRRSVLALSYFAASALSTLIVTYTALGLSLGYTAIQGWYMSSTDVLCAMLDVFILTLFGTSLSSCIHFFLSTNGQASAVGTIVSAGYGFICGAYMPISNFGSGLQKALGFLPGTYGTSLIRNHMMNGVFTEMGKIGMPAEVVSGIRDSIDCNLYFFGQEVSVGAMYAVTIGSVVLFTALFVLFHALKKKRK